MQVWATDITYMPLPLGFMYLTAVIALYSRYVLSWSLSNTMEADWCCQMVEAAIDRHGKPEILNTDQGAQYTSDVFSHYIVGQGIKLSMPACRTGRDGKGRATDNAFIERLWRTVKYENARFENYQNGTDMTSGMEDFFSDYNTQRRHSSLGDETPEKIYRKGLIGISNREQR
jgi:putative transposase